MLSGVDILELLVSVLKEPITELEFDTKGYISLKHMVITYKNKTQINIFPNKEVHLDFFRNVHMYLL